MAGLVRAALDRARAVRARRPAAGAGRIARVAAEDWEVGRARRGTRAALAGEAILAGVAGGAAGLVVGAATRAAWEAVRAGAVVGIAVRTAVALAIAAGRSRPRRRLGQWCFVEIQASPAERTRGQRGERAPRLGGSPLLATRGPGACSLQAAPAPSSGVVPSSGTLDTPRRPRSLKLERRHNPTSHHQRAAG